MSTRICLADGQMFDFAHMSPYDLSLDNIAHHSAKIQRFTGGTPINISYSVGEHCINLANYFAQLGLMKEAKIALLHDATESVMSDVVTPLKKMCADYVKIENELCDLLYGEYLLMNASNFGKSLLNVKSADRRIMIDEVAAIMPWKLNIYLNEYEKGCVPIALGCPILFDNHPSTVKMCFLTLCKNLGIK